MKIEYFFTNIFGGFSKKPYESLNLAFHVGDDEKNVIKNREILKKKLKLKNIVFANQIHSNIAKEVKNTSTVHTCDALFTNKNDIAIAIMTADCIALLLYDKDEKAIAAIHAGREGVFKQIAKNTIEQMQDLYKINPKNLQAIIGPCIHQCCYEINGDILEFAKKNYSQFLSKNHLDIKGILKNQLETLGVSVKDESVCTSCDKRYFSFRRDKITGRIAGIIVKRSKNV